MVKPASLGRRIWQTLSSIKTGIVLLILVGLLSIAGTLILQRPITEPQDLERAYSPQTLRWLDAFGLTDVFHAWWFVVLLVLISITILCASIDRFPNAWRFYARPYRVPDEHFRAVLPLQKNFPVDSAEQALAAAEQALRKDGFHPERVVDHDHVSLYAESHRFSVMAVYVVHASLLLIFMGGILDALRGYHGYVALLSGEQKNQIELRQGGMRDLGFSVRCDATGQQDYPDGSPKRWWSKLTVLENGREVVRKEIAVNDPLTYHGIRFFQSSYGNSGKVDYVALNAIPTGTGARHEITLRPDTVAALDADTNLRMAEFIPDAVEEDGHVYARSHELGNPALRLIVESKKSGRSYNIWLPPMASGDNAQAPYQFEARDLQMVPFTGLQVAHEPGQWLVWAGCLLMAVGLGCALYLSHMRLWALPVKLSDGRLVLWVGGTANKNREAFAERFHAMAQEIHNLTQSTRSPEQRERELALTGD
jgi:cytochrome c biogenesis protein